jgi:hypothetical protein
MSFALIRNRQHPWRFLARTIWATLGSLLCLSNFLLLCMRHKGFRSNGQRVLPNFSSHHVRSHLRPVKHFKPSRHFRPSRCPIPIYASSLLTLITRGLSQLLLGLCLILRNSFPLWQLKFHNRKRNYEVLDSTARRKSGSALNRLTLLHPECILLHCHLDSK